MVGLEEGARGRAGGSRGLRLVLAGAPGVPGWLGKIAQPTELVLGADAAPLKGWGGRTIKKTGA